MVVLSASIVTKGGKPIISRQFRELPRARLESLLSTFPKLVPPSSQHTVIDDPASAIRYVYQPLDDLWLVILTNRQSNILQDINTLHLLSRVASDFCRGGLTEAEVLARSFEILSSFDEVVCMGYREKVDLNGIRNVMEMESHEEKIQEIIARNKEQEAKEELKRRAKQLDMQRREAARRGPTDIYGSSGGMAGYERTYQPPPMVSAPREDSYSSNIPSSAAKPFKTKGMQLGAAKGGKGGRQQAGLLDALGDEYGVVEDPIPVPAAPAAAAPEVPGPAVPPASKQSSNNPFAPEIQEEVHFIVREKLTAELSRDGGLSPSSTGIVVSGSLDLRVASSAASRIRVQVGHNTGFGNDLQFKTHPNVDKKAWSDGKTIQLRDPSKGFPIGQGLGVLKWRLSTKDESYIPLSINCWPTANDNGSCDVNIEYELESDEVSLVDVVISIPLPSDSYPTVASSDGSYVVNPSTHALDWQIPSIDQDSKSGSMEFSCPGADPDAFFPVSVAFLAEHGLCGVKVSTVSAVDGHAPVNFSVDSLTTADEYTVV